MSYCIGLQHETDPDMRLMYRKPVPLADPHEMGPNWAWARRDALGRWNIDLIPQAFPTISDALAKYDELRASHTDSFNSQLHIYDAETGTKIDLTGLVA